MVITQILYNCYWLCHFYRLNNSVSPMVSQLALKAGAKAAISCDFLAQRNEDYSSGGSCFSVLVRPL